MNIDNLINYKKANYKPNNAYKKALSNQIAHQVTITFSDDDDKIVCVIGSFDQIDKEVDNWFEGKGPLRCCSAFSYTANGLYLADQIEIDLPEDPVSVTIHNNETYVLGYMNPNYTFNYVSRH